MVNMPAPKGQLTANRPLADLTWMRVGGPADWGWKQCDCA